MNNNGIDIRKNGDGIGIQIDVMNKFCSGKVIEQRNKHGVGAKVWNEVVNPLWNWSDYEYRVKKELSIDDDLDGFMFTGQLNEDGSLFITHKLQSMLTVGVPVLFRIRSIKLKDGFDNR